MTRSYIFACVLAGGVFASGHALAQRNARAGTPTPPAREEIAKCEVAVRFNTDEKSVAESEYLDGMWCLGLMQGVLGTGAVVRALNPDDALFCVPDPGIKHWIAAQAVVAYAKAYPEHLDETITDLAVRALAARYPCAQGDAELPPQP